MDYILFREPVYSRPLSSEKIREGLSVGEGATLHRLVLDGQSIFSSSVKTANNKIPVSSVFNDSELKDCAERLSAVALSVGLIIPRGNMPFGSRGPSEFATEMP